MKKIIKLLTAILVVVTFSSCDSEVENFTGNAAEGGAIVKVIANAPIKALGQPNDPNDLENTSLLFTDAEVNFDVKLKYGGVEVANYEIVKTLNGQGTEVSVASGASLPLNVMANTIDELISGLGIASDDLRVNDQIVFRTKLINTNGDMYYASDSQGTVTVTISCASDLAGSYDLTTSRDNGADAFFPGEVITEISPGYYKTTSIYRWDVGSIAPDQGFNFNDVCGTLQVPLQGLAQGYYSNDVEGTDNGSVDSVTGNLVISYYVGFASGNVTCVGNYVKL